MPQLDPMSFITQINWFIITFTLLLGITNQMVVKITLKKGLRRYLAKMKAEDY